MGHPLVDGTHTQPVVLYIDVAGVMTPVGSVNPLPISGGGAGGGDASEAEQEVQTTELQGINAKLTTIDGRVDGLETLQQATTDAITALSTALVAAIETQSIDLTLDDDVDPDGSLPVGGRAKSGLSTVPLVATDDRIKLRLGRDGSLYTRAIPLPDIIDGFSAAVNDTTVTTMIAAAGAGIKTYLKHVSFSNSHATSTALVTILSGAVARTGLILIPPGGREINFPDLGLPPNAANETWRFQASVGVTSLYASCAIGFKTLV